jgi:hypothetical protein
MRRIFTFQQERVGDVRVPQWQPGDYDFVSSRQFEEHRTEDNRLNSMQFVVGFRIPGQLPFTFDIALHACIKVCEQMAKSMELLEPVAGCRHRLL